MSNNKVVKEGVSSINNNIKNTAESAKSNLNEINDTLTNIAQDVGEGLKLTAKKLDKDKKTDIDLSKLKDQLDGLKVFAPDIAAMLDELLAINTTLLEKDIGSKKETSKDFEKDKKTVETPNINTDSREPKDLASLTKLSEITGTGFSIVGNILKDLYTLFDTVLQGVSTGQVSQALVANASQLTASVNKDQAKTDNTENSKGVLAGFFQSIAGPLESVAAGLLMISVATAILQTLHISSELIGSIVTLGTFIIATFTILNKIKTAQQKNPDLIDKDGSKDGSILNTVLSFSVMVGVTAGALLLCSVLADTIVEKWSGILIGLGLIFGTALISLTALNGIALILKPLLGKKAPIVSVVKDFSSLVFTISFVSILCGLLEPVILSGLTSTTLILAETLAVFTALSFLLKNVGKSIKEDKLAAFGSILKTTTVLIGLISVLTIVLGIIPTSIIIQGTIAMSLLIGLVDTMFVMLGKTLQNLNKVSAAKLQQLFNILTVTTVLIGLISVLTIVLGSVDSSVIIQGLTSMVLIATIPIILIEVLSKVAKKSSKFKKALQAVALTGILTAAVAGVAWVIISILGKFETSQVLSAMLAVGLTTILIATVGVAAIGLAYLATALGVSVGPALAAIGIASAVSIAIAGVAFLLATILKPETAQAAVVAVKALVITATALVVIGTVTITLGALAIPLAISSALAIVSLLVLGKFIESFVNILAETIIPAAELLSSVNLEVFTSIILNISNTLKGFVELSSVLLVFNLIAVNLIVQIGLATASLLTLNVGLFLFITQYNLLAFTLSNVDTTDLNLTNLSQNITALAEMSEVINNFVAPSIQNILAVNFAMNFAINFAKKIKQIGDDNTVTRVVNLANSLANLASNASGLSNLATSIQAVVEATKNLNEVQGNSKISVEALTGQVNKQADMIQRIEKVPEKEDNTSQINAEKVISLLENMTNEMQAITNTIGAISQNQTTLLKRNDSVSTRFM